MPSTKPRSALSLTEQLALLENPAPTDFDPEALEQEHWDSEGSDGSEESGDEEEHTGREHYVAVGKSKLRKGHPVLLDPKYNGAKVSRDKLYDEDEEETGSETEEDKDEEEVEESDDELTGSVELNSEDDIRAGTPLSGEDDEIDSDDALGSEEEKFTSFKFRGSTTTPKTNGTANSSGESSGGEAEESDEGEVESGKEDESESSGKDEDDEDDDHDEDNELEDDEDEDESEGHQEEEVARREQLRKMMAEEQKNVVANISKAAKADAEKGTAVRQQQKTFDSFLSIRIKLQKALISTNSLPETPAEPESWKAAEGAALKLWNILHDLRCDLSDSRTGTKRGREDQEDTPDTTTDTLSAKMRKLDRDASAWRESTLDKWSNKTQSVATTNFAKKLNNTVPTPRSLTGSIRETLSSDQDRLVARTRTPRSMAPTCTVAEDPEIFDDTDFYQLLLKALVDRRMVDGAGGGSGAVRWTTAMRDAKKKKIVDTKASKGRKLRYQVQEKIQNFMAPMDNNAWHEQQIDELFSSLLGQKVKVDEEDEDVDAEDVEMDGLRLFKS